jgi:ornithine cyclodeaminase/alanine dehydrogenase
LTINRDILYLTHDEMAEIGPSMGEIVGLLDSAFRLKGEGKATQPPKHWIPRSDDRFCSAMSSYIPSLGFSGCKWQSGDPGNSARGLPYIQGLYILTEDIHGIPVAIMDAEWITGRRTAAASALCVKYFVNPGAQTLCILGCGLQGRVHLEAIRTVMPKLSRVQVFDVRREVAESFARDLAPQFGVEIVVAPTTRDAVVGADVVISGGPILTPPRPSIAAEWLKDGVVGVTIDYDSYWTPEAMRTMATIVTDDRGQIEHLKEYGLFLGVPRLDGELADVIAGNLPGRKVEKDRILCFNLGIALEDLVTAVEIYQRAKSSATGRYLPR